MTRRRPNLTSRRALIDTRAAIARSNSSAKRRSRCHPTERMIDRRMRPPTPARAAAPRRRAGRVDAVEALFALPFTDLLFRAQQVHRAHHAPNAVQLSTLLSIKTGGCPGGLRLLPAGGALSHRRRRTSRCSTLDAVRRRGARGEGARARRASAWARRGAARRSATSSRCSTMVREVKALGLETCARSAC